MLFELLCERKCLSNVRIWSNHHRNVTPFCHDFGVNVFYMANSSHLVRTKSMRNQTQLVYAMISCIKPLDSNHGVDDMKFVWIAASTARWQSMGKCADVHQTIRPYLACIQVEKECCRWKISNALFQCIHFCYMKRLDVSALNCHLLEDL